MSAMPAADPAGRIAASFLQQGFMQTLGAIILRVAPGEVDIELPVHPGLTQQNGFVHAGAVSTIADTACGYAAFTMMPPQADVLTVEFKINLLAPALGERLIARGRIVKAGRTLTLAMAEVFAVAQGREKLCAMMTATLMTMLPRGDA